MHNGVLLDTSFFVRLINQNDPLSKNAENYFMRFLQHNIPLYISTISVAEYCVVGKFEQLPLKNIRIIPFNLNHARRAAEFAHFLYLARRRAR
jgi:predicted nucleic acid-binding protein